MNQTADALSHHQKTSNDNSSDSEGYETISYNVVCDDLYEVIKGGKLPLDIKRAVQAEMTKQLPDSEKNGAPSQMVDILFKVTLGMIKRSSGGRY